MISALDAKEIARRGGSMILDVSTISAADLKEIAANAATGGGTITYRNAKQLSVPDAQEIATRSKGRAVLDYTT